MFGNATLQTYGNNPDPSAEPNASKAAPANCTRRHVEVRLWPTLRRGKDGRRSRERGGGGWGCARKE